MTFHTKRWGDSPASAIFPLPIPFVDLFGKQSCPKLNARQWKRLCHRRALHVLVVALNYIHNGLKMAPLAALGRRPNMAQKAVYKRLQALLIACEKPGSFPLPPGRSGFEFIAKLIELEHFASSCPACNFDYSGAAEDVLSRPVAAGQISGEHKFRVTKPFSPVQPYRTLDASRLKLSGDGAWDMQEYLEGILWLPFQDPSILLHGDSQRASGPDFKREDVAEYLKLAKLWDSRGLLAMFHHDNSLGLACRVFNAHKNELIDRQIGDRRWYNSSEYHPKGPSAMLPSGSTIASLHCPKGYTLFGSASDRKDFYHQATVTRERALTNLLPFQFNVGDLPQGVAYEDMLLYAGQKFSRTAHGDRYGFPAKKPMKKDEIGTVYCGFKSLFQGDHLGVEFALESHSELLGRRGLLAEDETLLAHRPIPRGPVWQGLVIDDYFAISCERVGTDSTASASVRRLSLAESIYQEAHVFGSDEKTVRGAEEFKVIGAEVTASEKARSVGLVTVGAPLSKRIATAALSLRTAALPVISRTLAARLSGNWISVFMYRRCFGCLLGKLFGFSNKSEADADEVCHLDRTTAEELVLASIFGAIAVTDISVPYDPYVYATDASNAKGAYTKKHVGCDLATTLWLGGDRKGAYTMLDAPARSQLRGLGFDADDEPLPMDFIDPPKVLDFEFDLVEICGGSGTLSKAAEKLGMKVCPPIDLSSSPHHDMQNPKLLNWIFQMIKERRFRSVVCEPPCTTFSPAQHPASRSYSNPLGFDRSDPSTYLGNLLAFRCLAILWFCWREMTIALLEQPRLSKMAWLRFWKYLLSLGFEEAIIHSCAFGSIHKKPFRLLGFGLDMASLNVPCPGGHVHVKVEGKYTKASAVYHPDLAHHIAVQIKRALQRQEVGAEERKPCHESVVINDILLQPGWEVGAAWEWRCPGHINVLESRSFVGLEKEILRQGGDRRFTALLDSRVAKGAHAKGRSSAYSLRPSLLRSCSYQISGNLHPSYGFAPTRINTADAPSRDSVLPSPSKWSVLDFLTPAEIRSLHSHQFSRATANWIRLYLLLVICSCPVEAAETWSCGFWTFSGNWRAFNILHFAISVTFISLAVLWIFGLFARPAILTISLGKFGLLNGNNHFRTQFHAVAIWGVMRPCCAMPMTPANRDEIGWASRRSGNVLQADRVILQRTRDRRTQLLSSFDSWLATNLRTNLETLLDARALEPEVVNEALVAYGQELYVAGKSYGVYSETINAVTSRRPILRRQVAAAWDLAFNWAVDEPHEHHSAMPLSVMLSICSLALLWGWTREACVIAAAWAGVLRVGEIIAAYRRDLVLPCDAAPGFVCALLKVQQPKTRGRAARHQSAKIEPTDIVRLLEAVYKRAAPSEKLWHLSPATLRKRFNSLQAAIGLTVRDGTNGFIYTLASLRPGGATHWLQVTEDAEFVRRKGRWVSSKVLEIYLQEATVATFVHKMTDESVSRVALLSNKFPEILEKAIYFKQNCIPENAWPRLW